MNNDRDGDSVENTGARPPGAPSFHEDAGAHYSSVGPVVYPAPIFPAQPPFEAAPPAALQGEPARKVPVVALVAVVVAAAAAIGGSVWFVMRPEAQVSRTTAVDAPSAPAVAQIESSVQPRVAADAPTEVAPVQVSSLDLEVGDCLVNDLDTDAGVDSVGVVPCAQEHFQEVYAVGDMADGDFPGEDAVSEESQSLCLDAFEGFIGAEYNESEIYVNLLYPTEGTWSAGDREIVCLAYDPDGSVTGTLEGAGR